MDGKNHSTIGVAAVTSAMSLGIIPFDIFTIGLSVIGSLLPDIDHQNSTINNVFNVSKMSYLMIAGLMAYFNRTSYYAILALVFVVIAFSKHRGVTHSLVGCGVLLALTWRFQANIRIGLVVGYTLHLFADFLTPQGIEIFYPSKKNYRIWKPFIVKKGVENILSGLCTLLIVFNAYNLVIGPHDIFTKILNH